MITIRKNITIKQSLSVVFYFAGNYANDPKWRKGVISMEYDTKGEPAAGSRTRETMKMLGSKGITIAEILEFTDLKRTAFRSLSGPMPCEGFRLFEQSGSGTTFTYSLTLKPSGLTKLFEAPLKLLFERRVQQDLLRLRTLLEK